MKRISLRCLFQDRAIATFYLVLMCVQLLFIEGWGVSPIKTFAMALAPIVLLVRVPYISKAVIIGLAYIIIVLFCALLQSYVRVSTIGYLAMFVFTFMLYYNLIYSGAFSMSYFMKVLRVFIFSFFVFALLQQLFSAVGIKYFPILNMVGQSYLSPMHFNTLTFEPSSSARVLAFLFLAYLRMHEYVLGHKPTIGYLWTEDKWILIAFLYTMVMMGSGTAMVCIIIMSVYFFQRKHVLVVVPLLFLFLFLAPRIKYAPLQRAVKTINATMTLDVEEVSKADASASLRVAPLINTLTKMDLMSSETWFGSGTSSEKQRSEWYNAVDTMKIGNIDQYGLLSYIVALLIIFLCCIPRFFSIETLLVFVALGMTINNIAYVWGCYFILLTIRYFDKVRFVGS